MARLEDLFDDAGHEKAPGGSLPNTQNKAGAPPAGGGVSAPYPGPHGLRTLKVPFPAAAPTQPLVPDAPPDHEHPGFLPSVQDAMREGLRRSIDEVAAEAAHPLTPAPTPDLEPGAPPPAAAGPVDGDLTVADVLAGLPFAYLSGAAGTGKTYLARQILKAKPDEVLFCATTGIAAVNLGDAVTINSALSFFDTQSLMEHYASGFLQYRLRMLRRSGVRIILVDEISMMDADQLTILCQAIDEIDQKKTYDADLEQVQWTADDDGRLKLLLVGDFAQLPPVKAPFAFESVEWSRFTRFTLTTIRRQGDKAFVEALQAVRKGNPQAALPILEPRMVQSLDFNFAGTTIVPKNDAVDRINNVRYAKLAGAEFGYKTIRSGDQEKDWIRLIPEELRLKKGALVMILANKPFPRLEDEPVSGYYYVNGDLATVIEQAPTGIRVMLHRTFEEVVVTPAVKEKKLATGKKNPRWEIKGTVTYMPLRLAYATTVHKSQGLSLDEVQISIVDGFFAAPGMMYVALSRARTLEGLRIVGNPKMFLGRCGMDKRIGEFL